MKKFYRHWFPLLLMVFGMSPFHGFGQYLYIRPVSIVQDSKAYWEYLPPGYTTYDTVRYPLMIYIHGAGDFGDGTPTEMKLILRAGPARYMSLGEFPATFTVNGKAYGFILVCPQFMIIPTSAQIDSIIDFCIKTYKVDVSRIYLTGLSMGGAVTWKYAGGQAAYANRLAGIVPVCGDALPDSIRGRIIAASNLPVWATHNNADPVTPVEWSIQQVAWINDPPPPDPLARLTIFQDSSHDAWTTTYDPTFTVNNQNIYEWMLNYSRPSTTEQLINVDLYAYNDAYANSAWNNWNIGSGGSLSSAKFRYSNGASSTISAVLSAQSGVTDNGSGYTVTMCPDQVARFPSYYSGSVNRTLTLNGLDSTKTYQISLFATCGYLNQTTTFSIGGTNVTIATGDNTSNAATFTNLKPSGGKIVVRMTHSKYFDYINGFTLTETTTTGLANAPANVLFANATMDSSGANIVDSGAGQLVIYPDPVMASAELQVNQPNTGRMKVDIYTAGGILVKEIMITKTTTFLDIPLSLDALKPGNYFLVATVGTWRRSLKLQKL